MHSRSKSWHLIDYVIVRQRDTEDVRITRVMRGADATTDHMLLRTKLKLIIRQAKRREAAKARVNVGRLADTGKQEELQAVLRDRLNAWNVDTHIGYDASSAQITAAWSDIAGTLRQVSLDVLGVARRKNRDWFDEKREDIRVLLDNRNKAHEKVLRNPSAANQRLYGDLRALVQRELRCMQNDWWCNLAQEIQGYADRGDQQHFFAAVKASYGAIKGTRYPVRSADGQELLTERSLVLERWAEHYRALLNRRAADVDLHIVEELPQLQPMLHLDTPPTEEEVRAAIKSIKNCKAPGPDGVAGEVLRCGGEGVVRCMVSLVAVAWEALEGSLNSGKTQIL